MRSAANPPRGLPRSERSERSGRVERVVLASDDPELSARLADAAARARSEFEVVDVGGGGGGGDGARTLLEDPPAAVWLDPTRDDAPEAALFDALRERWPDTPIVVVSRESRTREIVKWLRAGAWDYLAWPQESDARLGEALEDALDRARQCAAAARARAGDAPGASDDAGDAGDAGEVGGIVARSPKMKRALEIVRSVAGSSSTVLIQAESGTGKELIARAIHASSERAAGPFVPIDCGALPEALIEGELFGCERGAFTGAERARSGLFRSANGGTLFLDEVGELPLAAQAKLLRVLQQREVRPLGSSVSHAVDVRIVAATNRDLRSEVQLRRFRADLYYRLRVVSIPLPPLRERREDVVPLAGYFVERFGAGRVIGIEPDALDALLAQRWEGNVRELEHTLEAAVALARGPFLRAADLDLSQPGPDAPPPSQIPLALEAYERACIREALHQSAGDVRRAAGLLGIGRSTLYRKMVLHGLSQ